MRLGAIDGLILFLCGVVPMLQPARFGRVFAAFGGVFVVLSLVRGWWLDGTKPDRTDLAGALLCVIGGGVMIYRPRTG